MQKTEFYKPTGLPGEKQVPSISVDADKLYGLLLRAELMMNAVNRRRYADRAIEQIQEVIKEFTLAYDFELDRYDHLKRMWGAARNASGNGTASLRHGCSTTSLPR